MEYKKTFNCNFYEACNIIKNEITNLSVSTNLESEIDMSTINTKIKLFVFERYSYFGKNRVTLTILVVSENDKTSISMVSSGGSQAMFFKINKIGENSFLEKAKNILENKLW